MAKYSVVLEHQYLQQQNYNNAMLNNLATSVQRSSQGLGLIL